MSAFDLLKNACEPKTYKSFDELVPGQYVVHNFKLVNTKHGQRICILVENSYMYLPKRFSDDISSPSRIDELNKCRYLMTYAGKDKSRQNRVMLKFIQVANVSTESDGAIAMEGYDTVQ